MLPVVQAGGGAISSPLSGHDSSKQQHKSDMEHPSNNAFSASGKTKKRDRSNHQSGDSSERSVKPDESESKRTRRERNNTNNGNKVEDITSFLDKNGGLSSNSAGVDSLYNLVRHHDQAANRVAYRTRVASVIAASDRDDCLNRFIELGGLGLLDDWLQEAHRGKLGGDSAKESADEGIDDLLLTLLRALEKLPVDLDSLKSSNVGKSVNHLRSHKSPEIGKKARKLVDLWKRKVESEMKQSGENTKNGALHGICGPFKSMTSNESPHVFKSSGGSVDGTARSSSRSAKSTVNNNSSSVTGEVLTKPIPVSLGKVSPLFSTTSASIKENSSSHMQGVSSSSTENCNASIPDERTTTNQHPSCNGVAYSNGQNKSTCAVTNTKSGGSTRPPTSAKGLLATGLNGTCMDVGSGKPLSWSWSEEKSCNISVESDKSQNESVKFDSLSNQRLIVRLPNLGRNPLTNNPAETGVPTNRSPPHGLDPFNGNRSQPASCIEDALTSVTTKTGGTNGLDQNKSINMPDRGIDEIGRQCRAGGEADCQSSESQLSFNSSGHCCTARLKETPSQSMENIQDILKQKSEQCSTQASDAENIGMCLLACVAADESSRSEKDLASAEPTKNKNFKDGESIERANTSGECIKPHLNSTTVQAHGDADATDAQESVGCNKSAPACEVQGSEIAAVTDMGQADENTRAIDGYPTEHLSPSKALKGASPGDDRSSGHSHTEQMGSALRKCQGEGNAQAFKMEPSLDDKKQVLHHSRNAEGILASMTGSGRYEDDWRDEKIFASKSATESKCRLPVEDALEVAVQVAKEVEQKYGKTAQDKDNPEASTNLEKIVPSNEFQVTKEGKQNIIDHSNDVEKCSLYIHSQPEGSSTPVNPVTVKTERQDEKFDFKEIVPSITSPSYKQNDHSTCSLQTSDGGTREGKKLKFAEDDLQNGSPRTSTPEQTAEVPSSAVTEAPERHTFDLNEGIMLDESSEEPNNAVYSPFSPIPIVPVVSHSVVSSSLSTPISSKGAFLPPCSPFKARGELGWRGSAATSAFRPAEPRKTPDRFQAATGIDGRLPERKQDGCQPTTETDSTGCPATKVARPCLDFDLNVAEEGVLEEELASPVKLPTHGSSPPTPSNGQSGVRPYLDLNQVDESEETGPVYQTKPEVPALFGRSDGSPSGAKPIKHDFDLNDGLTMDDSVAANDPITSSGNVRILGNQAPPFQGPKPGVETINLSPWSHNGGQIPAMMPAFPSMRPETPFPVAITQTFFNVGQGQGVRSFHPDMFRPPVGFSSSPTAAFPYPAQPPAFPYTSYSFGAPFPAPSASFIDSSGSHQFPLAAPQILTSGAILPPPVRPSYMMGLTKVATPSNNDRGWGRPSLDLNAGPEPAEVDTREDRASVRQVTLFEAPVLIDEQSRVCRQSPISADSLKRKEPEGSWEWELYRSSLKQDTRR